MAVSALWRVRRCGLGARAHLDHGHGVGIVVDIGDAREGIEAEGDLEDGPVLVQGVQQLLLRHGEVGGIVALRELREAAQIDGEPRARDLGDLDA
jgi:hypothetical protein